MSTAHRNIKMIQCVKREQQSLSEDPGEHIWAETG